MSLTSNPIRLSLVLLTVVCGLTYQLAHAADDLASPDASTESKIAEWIQQLDADQFTERTAASRQLQGAGSAAIPALAEAAVGESREARLRSLDILRKHFEEGDEATKQAAKEALEGIAKGDQPAAERAKDILNPKKDEPPMPIQVFGGGGGQIQIRVNAIGPMQMQKIQINNAIKQIETQDGDRKIKVTEDPNKGIDVEITTKKDGKESTEKFNAKNAEELKKKHPEAYKAYEKIGKGIGNVQIQAGGIPMNIQPPQIRLPIAIPQAQRQSGLNLLKASRRFLENSIKQFEGAKENAEDADKLEASIKRLQEIEKQLEEEQAKLEE